MVRAFLLGAGEEVSMRKVRLLDALATVALWAGAIGLMAAVLWMA